MGYREHYQSQIYQIMQRNFRWGLVLALAVSLSVPAVAGAQSLAQDIEQLTLDYEKLSQLKKILSDMYTAYQIVSKGYDDIKNIAQGNFNLHQAFLDALLAISPTVRDYYKIVNIVNNEAELVKEYQAAGKYFNGTGRFSSAELDYFNTMYGNLLNGSLRNLEELTMVITAGQMRMSDAERLAAIDRIDKDQTDKLSFLRVFNNQTAIQAGQRGLEQNDISTMSALYGIGN
jgi:hypothetical protein